MERKVAVITGAGRGVGRAAAIELGRLGYDLALVARTQKDLDETARLAGGGMTLLADVGNSARAAGVIGDTVKEFGRVDAVIHSAAVCSMLGIEETTDADWDAMIRTNLSAAFYLARAAWPIFKRQKGGVIVNVSSESGRDPFPGFAAYASSKGGLNLFGVVAAKEGKGVGIRVHTIAPGAIETQMLRNLFTQEQFSQDQALDPAEVASVIADCVTGKLRHTSGEVIYIHRDR